MECLCYFPHQFWLLPQVKLFFSTISIHYVTEGYLTSPIYIYIYIYIYMCVCVCVCVCVCAWYLPTPPLEQDMTQGQFFKRSLTGLKSEFSFSKAQEPSLPYYLPIAGGRIIGFIGFPRVLVLCEMQPVSSRIWTRIACVHFLRR